MGLTPRILQLTAAVLSVSAPSCAFDTTPIRSQTAQDAGTVRAQSSDAAAPPVPHEDAASQLPPAPPSLPAMVQDAAPQAPPPVAQAGTAAPPPPAAGSGAPTLPPPVACDGIGSYGLQLALDLTWESTPSFSDPGRGLAKLYALVQVERVDPQTHALTARGQMCGLTLPAFATSSSCQEHEIRFDDALWSEPTLPAWQIEGSYTCAADGCKLQVDPTAYALGIHLDPPTAPWPAPGAASLDQFSDDDRDGLPGVSAEIVTRVAAANNPSCGIWVTSQGNMGGPMQMPMSQAQHLLLALRAQLSAAVEIAADCRIDRASATAQSLDLRAAGCAFQTVPDAGSTSCPDELRSTIDQSLPQYHVLNAGEAPSASMPARDTAASSGPVLKVLRLPTGPLLTCRQVRDAMF